METNEFAEDLQLVAALRHGDEAAFARLLDMYHASMVRLALIFVANRVVAEEVTQQAWLGVLRGLDGFEGRSSLKTWIFRILTNCAKTCAVREGRSVPFSAVWDAEEESGEPAVEPDRFRPAGTPYAGGWKSFPASWEQIPEEQLLAQESLGVVHGAIDALPSAQREVILLRDVEGWTSEEVCNVLGVSETNQRVLLHRARSRVRSALERYLTE